MPLANRPRTGPSFVTTTGPAPAVLGTCATIRIDGVPRAASTTGIATNANFLIVKTYPPRFDERQKGCVNWQLVYTIPLFAETQTLSPGQDRPSRHARRPRKRRRR